MRGRCVCLPADDSDVAVEIVFPTRPVPSDSEQIRKLSNSLQFRVLSRKQKAKRLVIELGLDERPNLPNAFLRKGVNVVI